MLPCEMVECFCMSVSKRAEKQSEGEEERREGMGKKKDRKGERL